VLSRPLLPLFNRRAARADCGGEGRESGRRDVRWPVVLQPAVRAANAMARSSSQTLVRGPRHANRPGARRAGGGPRGRVPEAALTRVASPMFRADSMGGSRGEQEHVDWATEA